MRARARIALEMVSGPGARMLADLLDALRARGVGSITRLDEASTGPAVVMVIEWDEPED